ncbi:MAG: sulfotransferase [Planctomycetia bacterium]|nr:sulfotransferase [Planctomycetia bacterium]
MSNASDPRPAKKREWAPRMWEGCDFLCWLKLLVRNRFAVGWRYWYIAVIVTVVSFFHMLLRLVQQVWYGGRIARTEIKEAPLFIIGHWRTGTTLLHELMILDSRHGYPNTYQCLEPNHFLLTENFIKRWLSFLMPSRRPMDNMAAGWDRPQEDEFALCMMGVRSPYLTIAFPNRPPQDQDYLDFVGVSPQDVAAWKRGFLSLLQRLTFRDPRRLVLKSPPHTCRIPVLLEMFPEARFVHIVRDPFVVFPSTVNLWKSLYETHGLQKPTFAGLEEHVFTTFLRVYEGLEKGRPLVEPSRFYEVRYEELVRDPVGQMRAVYEHLGLGGFDEYLPNLEAFLARQKGYETNRYQLSDERREEIRRRWAPVIEKYGYDQSVTPVGG